MNIEIRDDLYDHYRDLMQTRWHMSDTNKCNNDLVESELRKQCAKGFELDPLTRCKSRFQLEFDIRDAVFQSHRTGNSIYRNSYLCIDIRNFKRFVDVHGRTASDQALIAIAAQLHSVYPNNSIYRIGGDEFVIDLGEYAVESLSPPEHVTLKYTTVQVIAERNADRNTYIAKTIYHHLEKGMVTSSIEGNKLVCEINWNHNT